MSDTENPGTNSPAPADDSIADDDVEAHVDTSKEIAADEDVEGHSVDPKTLEHGSSW